MGRRSKSYEEVNSVETAVYFQVSERLKFTHFIHMLIRQQIHLLQFCPVFSWQRAEAIDNRRKSNRGPIVEDIRGSRQNGGNLMFTLNIPHKGYARHLFLETEVWSIDLPNRFERPAGQFTY